VDGVFMLVLEGEIGDFVVEFHGWYQIPFGDRHSCPE